MSKKLTNNYKSEDIYLSSMHAFLEAEAIAHPPTTL
jgi:hypothetical protein